MKDLRILLIQPASNLMKNRRESKPALMPLGLLYIAGTLQASGYNNVKILDVMTDGYYNETSFKRDYIRYGLSPTEIKKRISEFNPNVVGVSCMVSLRRHHVYEICKLTKEINQDIITIIGGNHLTCFPKEGIKKWYVDYVVLGEGEKPFLRLVETMDACKGKLPLNVIKHIEGIAYNRKGKYHIQPQMYIEPNLDNIPFPAHHLLDLNKYQEIWNKEGYHYYPARKFTMMLMARGCSSMCEHCPHNVIFAGYRIRSAKNIFEEVKKVHEELGVSEIQFHEYNAMVVWRVVKEFCELMIESGLNKKIIWGFPIGLWLKPMTYERLKLMKDAGMPYVDLAIESANQDILINIMKGKNVDLSHALNVIKWCRELGYYINCFFMLGLEGQSKKDVESTIEWSSKLDVDTIAYFIAQPLPGTPFWDHCVKQRLFLPGFDTFHLRYGKSNTRHKDMTPKELEQYRHKARDDFIKYWRSKGRLPYPGQRGKNFLQMRGVDCGC